VDCEHTVVNIVGNLAADTAEDTRHLMISYQWDSQRTVLHLRDRLKAAGFKIWIDVDNMCTYYGFVRVCA